MKMRMRAALGLVAGALTLGGALAAQSAKVPGIPSGTQLNPGGVSPGNGNYVVIGCVSLEGQGGAPNFVITDTRATPPVQYRLQGDADLLRFHVGHTVEIGGPVTLATGGAKTPTLGVKSLDYISMTCQKISTR